MANAFPEKIRIGTMVPTGKMHPADYIAKILPHGFESFSISWWQTLGDANLKEIAKRVKETLAGSGAVVSSVSVFGNPLHTDGKAAQTRDGWKKLIDAAPLFGCDLVTGFAGRVVDKPIDESIGRFAKVFGPLTKRAADKGVRLAFENCQMGGDWRKGDWNIAQSPDAWELMFQALGNPKNMGLQWEPCHQMVALIDPIAQLRKWVGKVFCLHGKDATICWDVIREHGIYGPRQFAFHRTPGFGDSNWKDIITILRQGGFEGSIDIEGWHDPVYRGELEMTGQVHGLNYLKKSRGGSFVPNPA
jgi:sugar phosphate isomerase/epimerase